VGAGVASPETTSFVAEEDVASAVVTVRAATGVVEATPANKAKRSVT